MTVKPEPAETVLAELAADLAEQVGRQYRVAAQDVLDLILADWRRQPRLVAAVTAAGSAEAARRLRVYRDAASRSKRQIYQRLRRYRPEPDRFAAALAGLAGLTPGCPAGALDACLAAVAAAHVSTAERLPHRAEFAAVLATVLTDAGQPAGNVIDVGCGVLPLLLPAGGFGALGMHEYWALDKDPHAGAALREYARLRGDQVLRPVGWHLADGWPAAFAQGVPTRCDAGLLLKVVPVVARQAPELLPVLAAIPADRLLISGSRIAMAKRQDIERRERRLLQRFCDGHGLEVREEFRTGDEFCLLAQRR